MTTPVLHVAVTGSSPVGSEKLGRTALEATGWLLAPGHERHHLIDVRHDGESGTAELLAEADRMLANVTVSEVPDLWLNSSAYAARLDVALAFPRHKATEDGSQETWLKAQLLREHGVPVLVVWHGRLHPYSDSGTSLLRSQADRYKLPVGPGGDVGIYDIGTPF